MTNLQRRLRKLEAGILDSHGLIPNTPEWLEFWGDKIERLIVGEDVDLTGITLAVTDAIIAAGEREDCLSFGEVPVGNLNEITGKFEPCENARGRAYGARKRLSYRRKKGASA